jgi:hypothetical protein
MAEGGLRYLGFWFSLQRPGVLSAGFFLVSGGNARSTGAPASIYLKTERLNTDLQR